MRFREGGCNRRAYLRGCFGQHDIHLRRMHHDGQAQHRSCARSFADGSHWRHQAGHRVMAAQNPITSLADDIATTRKLAEWMGVRPCW